MNVSGLDTTRETTESFDKCEDDLCEIVSSFVYNLIG